MKLDHQAVLAYYDAAVSTQTEFQRKRKTMPYTSANGYMFSFINKDGLLGVRLPKEAREKFLESHDSVPFLSHGATMKDYVVIPNDLLGNIDVLSDLLIQGFKHVMSLPPK